MNIITFGIRAFNALMMALICVSEFSDGRLLSGLASLCTAIVILIPIFRMLYLQEKLAPVSTFKTSLSNIVILLSWSRTVIGFMLAIGGAGMIDQGQKVAGCGTVLVGIFLLSPLSKLVFSYPLPAAEMAAQWNDRITVLVFGRTVGLIFIMVALGTLNLEDNDTVSFYIFLVIGVLLIFFRQIRNLLITPEKNASIPSLAVKHTPVMQSTPVPIPPPPAHTSMQFVPAAQIATARPPLPPIELEKLLVIYNRLRQLNTATKGAAYADFLNALFRQGETITTITPFRLDGTNITGSFELEGQTYILTAQWQGQKCGHDDLLLFNGKVEAKSTWARGIFINDAGFTSEGLETFSRGTRTSIIAMDGNDLLLILNDRLPLVEAIKRKARKAVETNQSFVPLQTLI